MVRVRDMQIAGSAIVDYAKPALGGHPTCDECRVSILGRKRVIRLWDQIGGGMTSMFFCQWKCVATWAQRKVDDGYT